MNQFYKIAGLRVRMDTFGRTQTQATPYLCAPFEEADIEIQSKREAMKKWAPNLDDNDLEYMGTGTSFYRQLLNYDGLLLHSSAVMMDGEAYLFSAPSGTGKSTHTQLWRKRFGDRAQILNDDKPALRLEDGRWYAYGTPWNGKERLGCNMRTPLKHICFIERSETNYVEPMEKSDAIDRIFNQVYMPKDPMAVMNTMQLIDRLLSCCKLWTIHCNMEPSAAETAYKTIFGK